MAVTVIGVVGVDDFFGELWEKTLMIALDCPWIRFYCDACFFSLQETLTWEERISTTVWWTTLPKSSRGSTRRICNPTSALWEDSGPPAKERRELSPPLPKQRKSVPTDLFARSDLVFMPVRIWFRSLAHFVCDTFFYKNHDFRAAWFVLKFFAIFRLEVS